MICHGLSSDFETTAIGDGNWGERICVHDELSVNERGWA